MILYQHPFIFAYLTWELISLKTPICFPFGWSYMINGCRITPAPYVTVVSNMSGYLCLISGYWLKIYITIPARRSIPNPMAIPIAAAVIEASSCGVNGRKVLGRDLGRGAVSHSEASFSVKFSSSSGIYLIILYDSCNKVI